MSAWTLDCRRVCSSSTAVPVPLIFPEAANSKPSKKEGFLLSRSFPRHVLSLLEIKQQFPKPSLFLFVFFLILKLIEASSRDILRYISNRQVFHKFLFLLFLLDLLFLLPLLYLPYLLFFLILKYHNLIIY